MSAYTVTNRLGVYAHGQRAANGETIDLDDEAAEPLVKTGAIAPAKSAATRGKK